MENNIPICYNEKGNPIPCPNGIKPGTKIYEDPKKFKIADQNYNDSLSLYNSYKNAEDGFNNFAKKNDLKTGVISNRSQLIYSEKIGSEIKPISGKALYEPRDENNKTIIKEGYESLVNNKRDTIYIPNKKIYNHNPIQALLVYKKPTREIALKVSKPKIINNTENITEDLGVSDNPLSLKQTLTPALNTNNNNNNSIEQFNNYRIDQQVKGIPLKNIMNYLEWKNSRANNNNTNNSNTLQSFKNGGIVLPQLEKGGIPDRYKNKGFTKVGTKRKSTRPGKKWMVLAKKGDSYKIVHGGDSSMQDYSQHKDKERQKNFWNRMGHTNDVFSPRYWHKKLGKWVNGGLINNTGYLDNYKTSNNPYNIIPSNNITMNNVSRDIIAYPNVGLPRLMKANSGRHYFPEADYVTEVPQYRRNEIPIYNQNSPLLKMQDGGNYSIVDYLSSKNKDSSFENRKLIAESRGIENYKGTASQNIQLLNLLKAKDNPPVNNSVPVSAKSFNISNNEMPFLVNNYRNIEADLRDGVIVDKRTGKAFQIKNYKIVKEYPVLTGKNVDGNTRANLDPSDKNFTDDKKVTPKGYYVIRANQDNISKSDKKTYNNNIRKLIPISANNMMASNIDNLAIHETYNPSERNRLYGTDTPYASFGCVNCRPRDAKELIKQNSGDTLRVIDSKFDEDKNYIKSYDKDNNEKSYKPNIYINNTKIKPPILLKIPSSSDIYPFLKPSNTFRNNSRVI